MGLFEYLQAYIGHPWVLAFLIFISTFILEDAATLSSALLASYEHLPVLMAYLALLAGILLGDAGLYGLGYLAHHFEWAHKLQQKRKAVALHDWLEHRLFLAVVVARFIPGARLATYTTIGFFELNFVKYMTAVFFASILWTSILFWAIYSYGMAVVDAIGEWRWPIAIGLIVIFFLIPKLFALFQRKQGHEAA